MTEQKFQMVAKTFQGLEDVLRDELISLGAENVEMDNLEGLTKKVVLGHFTWDGF